MSLPFELTERPQWKPTAPNSKRPIGGPLIQPFTPADPYHLVIKYLKPDQLVGFCLTPDDPYICIDIDALTPEQSPSQEIRDLISTFPTYTELSQSGNGIHIWYKTDKSALPKVIKGVTFNGQISTANSFMVCTNNPVPNLPTEIATIPPSALEPLFLRPQNVERLYQPKDHQSPSLTELSDLTMGKVQQWLNDIPPSIEGHPMKERFEAVYESFTPPIKYSDYEHWRTVAAAVHDGAYRCANISMGEMIFMKWSERDQVKFTGSDDAIQKYYDNPPRPGSGITVYTLAALAKAAIPVWPYPIKTKTGEITRTPDPLVIENWLELCRTLNLKLVENEISGTVQIDGPSYILEQYFPNAINSDIPTCIHRFAQNTYFRRATPQLAKAYTSAMATYMHGTTNPVLDWLVDQPAYNPHQEPDYVEQLIDTLQIAKPDPIYRTYIRKNLMGITRALFYKGAFTETTGLVILQGPEATRKSSWLKLLLPQQFQHYVANSQTALNSNSIKELQMQAAQYLILIFDEAERVLSVGNSEVKNFFIQSEDVYRPLYSNIVKRVPRRVTFWGTTNIDMLRTSDEGNRRLWVVPVNYCDTDALLKIPLDRMYKQLEYEFKNTPVNQQPYLWTLTDEERITTNRLTTELSADSDYGLLLQETFGPPDLIDWNYYVNRGKFDRTKGMTESEIVERVVLKTGIRIDKRTALRHELKRYCGRITDTSFKAKQFGAITIRHGKATATKADGKLAFSRWILPLGYMEDLHES